MKRRQLIVGDVFIVPIDGPHFGLGQVIATYGKDAYFLAIFDAVVGSDVSPEDLDRVREGPLVFLALAMDVKLAMGDWPIVARRPVRPGLPLPAFKEMVGSPDRIDIVDYSGHRRRPSRPGEKDLVPNRKVIAPIRIEKALRARHGFGSWTAAYDGLRLDEVNTTERLFLEE